MANARGLPVSQRADRRWRLVGRAAAAVVLALNLGMTAANGARFQHLTTLALARGPSEPSAARPRIPGAVDAKDRLQAVAAGALANLTPAPDVGGLSRHLFGNEEERGWALP
jgi:hypothetical protein